MTTTSRPSHPSKSPMYGGFRGPTVPQPTAHTSTTRSKSPQHWGDIGGPLPAHTSSFSTAGKRTLGKKERKLETENQTYFSPPPTPPRPQSVPIGHSKYPSPLR